MPVVVVNSASLAIPYKEIQSYSSIMETELLVSFTGQSITCFVRCYEPMGPARGSVFLGSGGSGEPWYANTIEQARRLVEDLLVLGFRVYDRKTQGKGVRLG